MPNMLMMGEGGSINPERVLLVASLKSAPIKRLVKYTEGNKVINITYGYPQLSVIVFDNGMIAVTCYPVEELSAALRRERELVDA